MQLFHKKTELPSASDALPGRAERLPVSEKHFVLQTPMEPPWPAGSEVVVFGLGCFWGAERCFWQAGGVHSTQVGYAAGQTPNPLYEEVCTGLTGHNEVVRVVFDPGVTCLEALLRLFWESHDPSQGMRQGNDAGTQYRSGIYLTDASQRVAAEDSRAAYGAALRAAGHDAITTEIVDAPEFYYAEDYHQQYLAKNPQGYCGLGGTAVAFPKDAGGAA
jgi:peptide-methionine (S)-S-oxide reductase